MPTLPRPRALMMPRVTVELKPNGLPIARTKSPTCSFSYSAHLTEGRSLASIFTTARSVLGSAPMIFAENSRRSLKRSEEHTSELQSRRDLVCRLLLEKKKKNSKIKHPTRHFHNNQ